MVGIAITLAVLFVPALGVAYFVGRGSLHQSLTISDEKYGGPPQDLGSELQRCRELSDVLALDAAAFAAVVASSSPPATSDLGIAAQQLLTRAQSLTERLNSLSGGDCVARQPEGSPLASLTSQQTDARADSSSTSATATTLPNSAAGAASTGVKAKRPVKLIGPFADCRTFERFRFHGSCTATIYPLYPGPGREPMQCVVLTRDLSCTGIGLAHSQQLYPKQIVVLNVVGKILVGEICWCRRIEEHFYVAGCRLVKTAA